MWWMYFDVLAIVATERLAALAAGTGSATRSPVTAGAYLHFPMVAGIVLVAFGLKTTLAHVDDPLGTIPAAALLGGAALYLLAHVAFRLRVIGSLGVTQLVAAAVLVAAVPVATRVAALRRRDVRRGRVLGRRRRRGPPLRRRPRPGAPRTRSLTHGCGQWAAGVMPRSRSRLSAASEATMATASTTMITAARATSAGAPRTARR